MALASAKRHSELHAFPHRVQHAKDWSSVTPIPDPLFIAKMERAVDPSPTYRTSTSRLSLPLLAQISRWMPTSAWSAPSTWGLCVPVQSPSPQRAGFHHQLECPAEGFTSQHPVCGSVALPYDFHLLLPHRPHSGGGRPDANQPLSYCSTGHKPALDSCRPLAWPWTQAWLFTGLCFRKEVDNLGDVNWTLRLPLTLYHEGLPHL